MGRESVRENCRNNFEREKMKKIIKNNKIDWKAKLKILFEEERWSYNTRLAYCIMATWKGFPVMRHGIEIKSFLSEGTEIQEFEEENELTGETIIVKREVPKFIRWFNKTEIKKAKQDAKDMLVDWFNRMILNYDDLTSQQKHRLKKYEFIGENRKEITDPSVLKYVRMKRIKVREPFGNSYILVNKTVIIELL